MTKINAKEEIKTGRNVKVAKYLNLYRDDKDHLVRWSVEVIVRQIVTVNDVVIDDSEFKEEVFDSQVGELSKERVKSVVDQLSERVTERSNERYEDLLALVSIAKDLGLDLWITKY